MDPSQSGEKDSITKMIKHSCDMINGEPTNKLSMISDENMWIRNAVSQNHKKGVLNITINPSESPTSWTPLLHNLNHESHL